MRIKEKISKSTKQKTIREQMRFLDSISSFTPNERKAIQLALCVAFLDGQLSELEILR